MSLTVLLLALPTQASSTVTRPTSRDALSLKSHSTLCGPLYKDGVQVAIQEQKDCGGTLIVPPIIHAGSCTIGYKSVAECLKAEQFTMSFSSDSGTMCSAAQMRENPATTGVTCVADPAISTVAYAPGGSGTQGVLYGVSLNPSWCGPTLPDGYCSDSESAPTVLEVPYNDSGVPPKFTLYIVASSPGAYFAFAKTEVVLKDAKNAPSLDVSLSSDAPSTGLAVGSTANVTATVGADGGPLSDITFGGLTTSSSAVSVPPASTSAKPFSLAKGATKTFTFPIKGASNGSSTLSLTVNGYEANNSLLTQTATLPITVGSSPLTISMVTSPSTVKLKVNDKGEIIPQKVSVAVTFTNTSSDTLDNTKLLLLEPEPVVRHQQLNQLALDAGTLPVSIGKFAPKSHATKKFSISVTGDGKYHWRALALYTDVSNPADKGRAAGVGGDFESIVPPLFFTASVHADSVTDRNGANWVTGGTLWYVGGELKNLSSYQSLCVAPLIAQSTGNAITVGLQDVTSADATPIAPPLAGLVKPGQSIPLGMSVVTSAVGGTRGVVEVPVKAYDADPNATCELDLDGSMAGQGTQLSDDMTHIVKDSTSFTVHVDVSTSPDVTPTAGALSFFGGFAANSAKVFGSVFEGLAASFKDFQADPQYYYDRQAAIHGDPIAATHLLERANANAMAVAQLLVNYFKTATPAETTDAYDFVGQTFDKVQNDAYSAIAKKSDAAAKLWYGKLLDAEANGSASQVWSAEADLAGKGAGLFEGLILQLFIEGVGAKMSAEIPQMEEASAAATSEPAVLTTSKGGVVPAGRILSVADRTGPALGFSPQADAALQSISESEGVLLGARARQGVSNELQQAGAVWKNSNFHQKTVSILDIKYLQMNLKKGLLGFRSFTPAGEAYAKRVILEASLPKAEEDELLARLAARINEDGADFAHVEQLVHTTRNGKKGWVNAGFNATGSGQATSSKAIWRRFELVETPILAEDGTNLGVLYEPYQEDIQAANALRQGKSIPPLCKASLNTVMCPITGDIDLSYITDLYGGSLSYEKLLAVFKKLEAAGFAHTDLVTWLDQQDGKFFFPGKEKQLSDIEVGKEFVAQYAPDGKVRATYLAPGKQSITTGPNTYQLTIIGGYHPGMN
jgi:hypothetical protein